MDDIEYERHITVGDPNVALLKLLQLVGIADARNCVSGPTLTQFYVKLSLCLVQ
jgi:hypothetical protein